MTRYTPHFSIDLDGTVRQHLPLLRSFAMHDPHGILRDPYSLAQIQLGGIKMHETEIEPGDVERMARLLTLAAGVDPEAMDPLVTRMDPPARKWERYANQARALLTERDLAEEMAEVLEEVLEATDPEPCCEPEPSDWWLTDQWVLVDGEHPKYIKSGMVYHSKYEASKGTADAVHGPNSTLAAIHDGRMVPLSSALGQDTTQALTVTPGMLDVAARAYFYATTLSPSGEDGEDDWSTRVPRRVKNYIRDGLVAALDALEEHRMVETDDREEADLAVAELRAVLDHTDEEPPMTNHFVKNCKHGVTVAQCRCPGPNKAVHIVPCPPTCPPDGESMDEQPTTAAHREQGIRQRIEAYEAVVDHPGTVDWEKRKVALDVMRHHAPTDIRWLLDEVKRLRGRSETLAAVEAEIEHDADHSIIGIARLRRVLRGEVKPRGGRLQ